MVSALGHHGNLVTTMTARAPSAAVRVVPARATDQRRDVVGSSARAPPSRWPTAPGTVWWTAQLNVKVAAFTSPPLHPLSQERRLDSLVVMGSVQQHVWHRLRGEAAVLQQPFSSPRRADLRRPGSRGEVRRKVRNAVDKHRCLSKSERSLCVCPGCAMRRSRVRCPCCGQRGVPGLTAVLSVEAGSTPGPGPVRTETLVLDVPR